MDKKQGLLGITFLHMQPLVSIPVITYNSEKTVIQTLDSIKAQSYSNLELIISDDCSTDNTVKLCREWIDENKGRFSRVQIIVAEHNTGTSGNINRAEDACMGEWIKSIAGDDFLTPTSIADYIDFVTRTPEAVIVFGRCKCFGGSIRQQHYFEEKVFKSEFFNLSAQEQYQFLLKGNCVPASTVFINGPKMKALGVKCDERIPLLEDWPRWINLTKKGIKLLSLDKVTANYRLTGMSSVKSNLPSPAYYRSLRLFDLLYRYPLASEVDNDTVLNKVLEYECGQYGELLSAYHSKEYRIGEVILSPFRAVMRLIKKNTTHEA